MGEVTSRTKLRHLTLGVALGDLARGVEEQPRGSNKGPRITEALANAGIGVPAPWCVAIIQLWADEAAKAAGVKNPLDGVKREALVADYIAWARECDLTVPAEEADRGDLVCFRFLSGNHAGILLDPPGTGDAFTTIEGNTNRGGSREGYMLADKKRSVRDDRPIFIRWDYGVEYEKAAA